MHVKPAREFLRCGPVAVAADVEDQGAQGFRVGPVPDRIRHRDEHLGEPLEAAQPVLLGSRGCRRLARRFRLPALRRRFRGLPGGGLRKCRARALVPGRLGRVARLRRLRKWSRRRLGESRLRFFGWVQQAEPVRALAPSGWEQSAQAGEGRRDSSPPSVSRPPKPRTARPSSRTFAVAPLTFPSGPRNARVVRTTAPPKSRAACPSQTAPRATFSPSDAIWRTRSHAAGARFLR